MTLAAGAGSVLCGVRREVFGVHAGQWNRVCAERELSTAPLPVIYCAILNKEGTRPQEANRVDLADVARTCSAIYRPETDMACSG
ncbi:hypothetical protein PsYK624_057040 [Phanerochaete sordida]|uniref:Uncharacterized protein n=1 Tax=Phanerochaete sordida TaxID=48140 RepID=A0A9P3G836_9APHY|nr:hypothetical protein PsYK624_057040 [Phanerochaete sordida]